MERQGEWPVIQGSMDKNAGGREGLVSLHNSEDKKGDTERGWKSGEGEESD